jgi:hypothetical protein
MSAETNGFYYLCCNAFFGILHLMENDRLKFALRWPVLPPKIGQRQAALEKADA